MVEEEKQQPLPDPLEVVKEEETIKAVKDQLAKIDVLVCGECHEVFHYIEEFQQHRTDEKCAKQSTLIENIQHDKHTQIWGFMLWKNSKFKNTEPEEKTPMSSWNVYQLWCNLEQAQKDCWITAGKTLQKLNAPTAAKKGTENEQDPLADTESDMDLDDPLKSKNKDGNVENGGLKMTKPIILNKDAHPRKGLRTENGKTKVEYAVEKIVSKRYNPGKKTHEYLVKWENFAEDQNTWEPLAHLDKCKKLVEEFDLNLAKLKAAKLPKGSMVQRRPYRKSLPERQPELILQNTGAGRPQRTSKQKALNQVKVWCGNISDADEGGSGKRPYSDSDSDSFEKKIKLEEESSDSEDDRPPLTIRKVIKTSTLNGLGKKRPLPSNILIPDAQGVVRIDQKQLPALSSGVYVMSKTAGIIKLDSNTSKIATSGGHAVIKVAPKIGQTSIKVVKRDSTNGSKPTILNTSLKPTTKPPPGARVIWKKRPPTTTTTTTTVTTIVRKAPEAPKPIEVKIDEDESDGLEELPFPTDLPLPEPESPPGDFTLCPLTGKIVGSDYVEEKKEVGGDNPAEAIDNLVKLAAADILDDDDDDIKMVMEDERKEGEKTRSIEDTLSAMHGDDVPSTTSSILSTAISNADIPDIPVGKKETPQEIVKQKSAMNRNIINRTIAPKPSPQAIITRITPGSSARKIVQKAKLNTPPRSTFAKTPIRQTYSNKNSNIIKKVQTTTVYQASQTTIAKEQPEPVMNMPLLSDLEAPEPAEVAQEEGGSEQDTSLGDSEAPILITGEDGTIYQVAGQNEDGQTILIAQDADGQQQCLLVTSESASDLAEAAAQEAAPEVAAEPEPEPEPVVAAEPESDSTEDSQIVAQIVSAQPPSPGGTRKVVLMLPDGNLMMTEVTAEQYAALELDK